MDMLRQEVEASLAALDRQASRLSALSGGTRFSTLQKTQYSLNTELRLLRSQSPDEPTFSGLGSLRKRIDRLTAALSPPDAVDSRGPVDVPAQSEQSARSEQSAQSQRSTQADQSAQPDQSAQADQSAQEAAPTPADQAAQAPDDASGQPATASPAGQAGPAGSGSLRQSLIRGMIMLAPAPSAPADRVRAGFPFRPKATRSRWLRDRMPSTGWRWVRCAGSNGKRRNAARCGSAMVNSGGSWRRPSMRGQGGTAAGIPPEAERRRRRAPKAGAKGLPVRRSRSRRNGRGWN